MQPHDEYLCDDLLLLEMECLLLPVEEDLPLLEE